MVVAGPRDYGAPYPPPRTASILINNFNYGRYVGRAVESALAQTRAAQVVVVDDGSTDDSREVIASYGERLQAIFQTNAGQGAAMNAGFAVATGDVVFFLDADDMLAPDAVETVLAAWRPSTVLVQYPLQIVDEDGAPIGVYPDPPDWLADGDVRPSLLQTGEFRANITSGLAFRRAALALEMPLPADDHRNAADGYLVRAAAFLGPVQRLDRTLGSYRRHANNDSRVGGTDGLAAGFRKKLGYLDTEMRVTRRLAARHGLEPDDDLGRHNADYVGFQLSLLLTEPSAPAVTGLDRFDLLTRYMAARWASAWPTTRRLLAVTLATAAVMSPPASAARLLQWLHDPDTRPPWARALARGVRRG